MSRNFSFNPLFEIHITTSARIHTSRRLYLSILFLRFGTWIAVSDEAVKEALSILFLRFGTWIAVSDEAVKEALSILFLRFTSATRFT